MLASLSPPIYRKVVAERGLLAVANEVEAKLRYEQRSRKADCGLLAVARVTKRLEKGRYEQYLSSNAKQKKSC